jgi:hypothetical protein
VVPLAALLDLTSDVDVTTALLDDPLAWRVRVVEQIDVDSPVSALRRRSLQCAPLRPVLARAGIRLSPDADEALAVLPFGPIPKHPLLEFDVEGPHGTQAFLLPRAAIAARELALLKKLAADAGLVPGIFSLALMEAALGFTEAHWGDFRPDLLGYLASGSDLPRYSQEVGAWSDTARHVARALAPYAEVPSPLDSPVENPALVLPILLANDVLTPATAVEAVTEFLVLMAEAAYVAVQGSGRAAAAATFLRTLVDFGSYYELFAVVRVPLDEPFLVKMSDRRPLTLSRFRNAGEQSAVIADARSNHVALRVTDPNARLSGVRALTPSKDAEAYGTFTPRQSPQVHAAYAFEPDRDYRIMLTFRVAALWRLQLVPYALAILLFGLAVVIVGERPGPRELAVLVGPGALAASIVLAREPTALGSRLRRLSNSLVVAATGAVVAVSTWMYLWGA